MWHEAAKPFAKVDKVKMTAKKFCTANMDTFNCYFFFFLGGERAGGST